VHVRIGIQASYAGGFADTAREIRDLEQAGLDVAMVAEVYTFDAVSQLGYLAAVTERVELMSGILPIYSRTPALTAMTAAGLDFVSGGRFTLGLGASGPQVIEGWHGVPYDAPLQRTREVVEVCRQVWRRERLQHDGPKYRIPLPADQGTGLGKPLKMLTRPERDSVPIWIASLGKKNVQGTAEYADGWLPHLYAPELAGKVWGDSLAAGAAKRPAELGPLQIAAGGMVAIGDDVKGMLDFARPMFALYIGGMGARNKNFYNDLVREYGYEKEASEIQDLYLEGKKEEAAALVPDDLLEMCNLVGPESYVRERIAAFEESGVTHLNVVPVPTRDDETPATVVGRLKEWTA
jgi:F420-dependent oxidoreductase-like protein